MSDVWPIKKMFPSITGIYEEVSTPPKQEPTEHPYEYIIRAYEDDSLNSKLTGLPGYSPPWPIRVLNGATLLTSYVLLLSMISLIVVFGLTISAFIIESISTVVFTLSIPYTGWEIVALDLQTTEQSFSLVASPALLNFVVVWGLMIIFTGMNKVSTRLSKPYEDEYYEWLNQLEPPENGFPAGLSYALREGDFEYGEIPVAAPPAFRDTRRFEVVSHSLKTVVLTIVRFFLRMMFIQTTILYQQNEPPADPHSAMESRKNN